MCFNLCENPTCLCFRVCVFALVFSQTGAAQIKALKNSKAIPCVASPSQHNKLIVPFGLCAIGQYANIMQQNNIFR